jgi:GNAT superfamily N-acetyltransferase
MNKLFHLSNQYTLITGTPQQFTAGLRHNYLQLLEGNNVRVNESHFINAWRWAIITKPDSTDILAAGALKQTRLNQRHYQSVFSPQKASLSVTFNALSCPFDLGYLVAAPGCRYLGYGEAIISALLEQCADAGVLAITQDEAIRAMLVRHGFERQGYDWRVENGGSMSLYLRLGR